jgi:hypothetical protein
VLRGKAARWLIATAVLAITTADLWMMSRMATYAIIVDTPPLERLDESPVRRMIREFEESSGELARLFSRGPNLPTLLGVASTPAYLGIGPAEYFDPETAMPGPYPFDVPPTPEQIDWLRRAGVTHILSFTPLEAADWPVSYVWSGRDPFLNQAWGRREPLYLYRLEGSRGRLAWLQASTRGLVQIMIYTANRVETVVFSEAGGTLVLTDLAYPGWTVEVDDEPARALAVEGMYRGVEVPAGEHRVTWAYRPQSVWIGGVISAAAAVLLVFFVGWPRRRSVGDSRQQAC